MQPVRGVDPAALDLRVVGTRIDELSFVMDPPLELAGRVVRTREYVVMQTVLEGGVRGTGYVLTRGQPIGRAVEEVAQRAVGARLADLFVGDSPSPGRDVHSRAWAVADICAWDLLGQVQGVPTWQLLGGEASSRPVLLVAGYRRPGESDRVMAGRLAALFDRGYRWLKIAAEPNASSTAGLLAELRQLVPSTELRLVVDLGFAGPSVEAVGACVQRWAPYGLTWLEDPVPVAHAQDTAAVRRRSTVPIAAGDEASQQELSSLVAHDAVDVLRADATTTGGLTGLLAVVRASKVPASLHVYPEVHRHAASVFVGPSPVEAFPPKDPFDFVDRFMHVDDWEPENGLLTPPATPGLGFRYQPDRVAAHVVRSMSFGAGAR